MGKGKGEERGNWEVVDGVEEREGKGVGVDWRMRVTD